MEIRALPLIPPAAAVIDLEDKNITFRVRVRVIIYLRDYLLLMPAEIRALLVIPPAAAVIDLEDKNITLQGEFTAAIGGNPRITANTAGGGGNGFRG